MNNGDMSTGLGTQPKSEWPTMTRKQKESEPIDILKPGSDEHARVLEYLMERVKLSERKMSLFYPRWRVNERKLQAYIDLPDWDQVLKDMNDSGKPPQAVNIIVPYDFAVMSTIITYLVHTFTGRKPMFQVNPNKAEATDSARSMEVALQYQADHTRLVRHLYQWLSDGLGYGVGFMVTNWKKEKAFRTKWIERPKYSFGLVQTGVEKVRTRENTVVYEGNDCFSLDPFMALPDPRVPMTEVNTKGEFFFWRRYEGKHALKKMEAEGDIKYVDSAGPLQRSQTSEVATDSSDRSLISQGDPIPGSDTFREGNRTTNYYERITGTCEIIPAELGLGESRVPTKYLFSILNRNQIVMAEKFDCDHGKHPVAVIEPHSMGYGFGQPSLLDYLNPIQDFLGFLVNSHMDNVKTALNNMWVVDPSKVEMQDLKEPGPGKIIRLKRSAYGQDVRSILQQLQVADVTANHVRDFELIMRLGDALSGVNDNLRGLQDSGGRKTATEVRTGAEAGASRLAALAKLISSQGVVDLTEMMSLNTQQYLSQEFSYQILGAKGYNSPVQISPEMLVGDFNYPIHDGTLPLDRVALLDVWKEIFLGIAGDPQLRQGFNMMEIFTYMAELGGAKNIDSFKVNVQTQPTENVMNSAAGGKLVPMGGM